MACRASRGCFRPKRRRAASFCTLAPGGDLLRLRATPWRDIPELLRFARGFAAVLGGIHARRVFHGDLMP